MSRNRVVNAAIEQNTVLRPIPKRNSSALAVDRMRPLVLDLDGTLLRTDLLVEGIITLLRRNILMLIPLVLWFFRGRAFLKRKVAERAARDH
jgi:hypothetical protein